MCSSAPPPTPTWTGSSPGRYTGPVGAIPADRYRDELDRHQYRPEWTWIAEDEGRILARAIWWGFGDAAYPLVLDCVSADDVPHRRWRPGRRRLSPGGRPWRPG